MSGPKIVDIRLVQAMQERQRRLARKRFEQLQQQWKAQRQRIRAALGTASPMVDADEIKGIEQSIRVMDQRLAQLGEQASLEELISRGAEGLAFMDAELNRLQQKINSALLEARQRARSLQAAVADFAARLRAAGLEAERRELLQAPSLQALEQAAQRLAHHEQQQGNMAMQKALAELGITATSRKLIPKLNDPERDRTEQLLLQLELLDDSQRTSELRARLDGLDGEPDLRQRRLRLDSLALQISQALQSRQETLERQAILDDLEAQLVAFEQAPTGLLTAIAAQRQALQEGPALADLRSAVQAWCQQEARRLDGERIRKVVLASLRELGYDVREGMATGWVEGGSVMLHKSGSQDYAVELQDVNGRLRSQVVRYGDPTAPLSDQQQQRDTEIERQWCTAHARALESLRRQGIEAEIKAKREPGEVPVAVIKSAEGTRLGREVGRGNLMSNERSPNA